LASLTTRAKLKRYLGINELISADDSLLDSLIIAGTKRIERLAHRIFCANDRREWHDGDDAHIKVKNWPLIRVNRVMIGSGEALRLEYTGSDIQAHVSVFSDADHETTGIRLSTLSATGTAINTERTFANFLTLSLMATELNSVADWTVTQRGDDWSVKDLHPLSGLDAKATAVNLTRPDFSCPFETNYRTGIIEIPHLRDATIHMHLNAYDRPQTRFQMTLVDYRGGYDAIPADIEQVAHEFIRDMFANTDQPSGVQSENLGDYAYSLADQTQFNTRQLEIIRSYVELV